MTESTTNPSIMLKREMYDIEQGVKRFCRQSSKHYAARGVLSIAALVPACVSSTDENHGNEVGILDGKRTCGMSSSSLSASSAPSAP